ncbi:MAG: hypothetical protein OEW15_09230 [Nitrospirota bacterium]|nr:hypothetical protein [Nitrospirota bacterium]
MTQKHDELPEDHQQAGESEGHLVMNIIKILLLVAVLAGFWYGFDHWLSGK